jgi:hypothetical protein
MRTIAQKRPTGFYGLLSKKEVRVAVLLLQPRARKRRD